MVFWVCEYVGLDALILTYVTVCTYLDWWLFLFTNMEHAFSQSLPAALKKMGLEDVVAYLSVKSREDIVSFCFVARCKNTN